MTKKEAEELESDGRFWGSIVAGTIIGLIVGGSVALLFAPKSGRELRGDLEDAAETVREKAEATLDDLQEAAQKLAQTSRTLLDETRENVVRSVEAGRDAYDKKRQELTNELEEKLRGDDTKTA
ncbi:MAG: YtxH domain-containing protein [Armatimonadetes bacterium]|nr:YtxH domain-containing protein [Armatimonadota bacterium]